MSEFQALQERLDDGAVILLDGAVGTQLQSMGVPMDNTAWAATALQSHPYSVRRMHECYIDAGVDIVTTNTYSSARHNLEPLGLGDLTYELNLRAVALAQEARERVRHDRPVVIAGSVSNFGIVTDGEPAEALHRWANPRSAITAEQARANLHEQAQILAESGVDLLLVESTGGNTHRRWILQACIATGLPTWLGFRARTDADDPTVRIGFTSDQPLADGVAELSALGGSLVNVFHSSVDDTTAALPVVRQSWSGPIGVYPDAGRADYTAPQRNLAVATATVPEDFLLLAQQWVDQGVQVIGGCCGFELEYIKLLREGLPKSI